MPRPTDCRGQQRHDPASGSRNRQWSRPNSPHGETCLTSHVQLLQPTSALTRATRRAVITCQGWRSWNYFKDTVTQDIMAAAANAMVDRTRGLSLLDVGYEHIGLDDNYQACGYNDVDHRGGLGEGAVSEWPAYPGGKPLRSFHNASGELPCLQLRALPRSRLTPSSTDFRVSADQHQQVPRHAGNDISRSCPGPQERMV